MKNVLKWIGIGVLAILLLLVVAFGVIYLRSRRQLAFRYSVTPAAVAIPPDSAALERGRHFVNAITKCPVCHGDDLGGKVFIDAMPFGRFVAPNITRGQGGLSEYSDADWVRAIRNGVGKDGRGLLFMPSNNYAGLSPEDLGAIIAYLKSVPPVDRALPASQLGPIGRMVVVMDSSHLTAATLIPADAPLPNPVPAGITVEYGRYLTEVGGCTGCHRPDLKGSEKAEAPGTPPPPDLTSTGPLRTWTEQEFRTALRQGVRPDGSAINPFMPWQSTRLMTDDEIAAVWRYLKTR